MAASARLTTRTGTACFSTRQDQPDTADEDQRHGDGDFGEAGADGQAGADIDGAETDQRECQGQGYQRRQSRFLQDGGDIQACAPGLVGMRVPSSGQTFSISGLPSRPVGRKIRTSTRMVKVATSLYSIEK